MDTLVEVKTEEKPRYIVQLVWNREFHWSDYGDREFDNLKDAQRYAESLKDMGDGARVKKTRIVNINE